MGDIDLLRKFQAIDVNRGEIKEAKLLQLKSRIETDMFLLEFNNNELEKKVRATMEEHLQLVIEALDLYQHNKLTAEHMEKINHINRIYKR